MPPSPPPRKGRRLRLNKCSSASSLRKLTTCSACSKRYITYSGSSLCVGCRGVDSECNTTTSREKEVTESEYGVEASTAAAVAATSNTTPVVDTPPVTHKDKDNYHSGTDVYNTTCASGTTSNTVASVGKKNAVNGRDRDVERPARTISIGNSRGSIIDESSTMPTMGKESISDTTSKSTAEVEASVSASFADISNGMDASPIQLEIGSDQEGSSDDDADSNANDENGVYVIGTQEADSKSTIKNDADSNADDEHDVYVIGTQEADGEATTKNCINSDLDVYNGEDETTHCVADNATAGQNDNDDTKGDCRKDQHATSSLFFFTSSKSDSAYKCFICNADLSKIKTGLKGRMNHIKRCGKKHGIKAGDGAGEMHFCDSEVHENSSAGIDGATEYSWHDDAEADHAVDATIDVFSSDTQQDGRNSVSSNVQQQQQKQASLNSYFTRPVRSLDKVLLQGAKNVAKKQQIESKRKASSSSSASSSGGKRGGGGWKRKRGNAPISCPPYKRISNTSILVDAFHYANPALPQTHFLSHFHSDHYGGLTKHWRNGVIYCSLPTATLVHSQLGVEKKYLHPLPMNTATVIDANGKPVSVILLDAHHCPGAVMFLFELPSGKKILHVGDFRWDREIMLSQPPLRQLARGSNNGARLDDLYLDTTYCDEKYENMPTQKQAIDAAVDMAVKEMEGAPVSSFLPKCVARRNTTLLLFGSYTIGKEKIYMSCAKALGLRIYVEPRKLRILYALNFSSEQMQMFTTTKSEAQIWVVPMGHCSFKHMDTYLAEANASTKGLVGGYKRVVAFRPTGWTFSATNGAKKKKDSLTTTRKSGNKTIHGVPYSDHSSFAELVDCLLCLRPKRIIPTVSVSSSQDQVELLLRRAHAKEDEGQYMIS